MSKYPDIVVREVLETYKSTRNSPFKTARLCGINVAQVFEIVDANQDKVAEATERFGGKGRPEMEPYLVARRKVTDREWDNSLPEIVQARADYEAGTHTMATGRDGSWLLLYSIPLRRRVEAQPGYFSECAA